MYLKKINIRWECNKIDDPLKITFTEIPFIQLGRHQYQCHQGKDINYKKKENYNEKKRKTYYWPYIYKTPKTGTGYKKKGCLLVFNTKKLFTFTKYKIPTDTRYNRDKAAKSVKKFLSSLEQSKGKKEKVLDEDYHLS